MKILCIKTNDLPPAWVTDSCTRAAPFFSQINTAHACWIERASAEKDESYKQIIPYILLQNTAGELLCYKRHGTEKRLHGFYSCGVGGHIDSDDSGETLELTVRRGMERELAEELANFSRAGLDFEYAGLINDTQSAVVRVHLGLVFRALCKPDYVPAPAEELDGAVWKQVPELRTLPLETWSALALRLLGVF